MNGGGGGGQTRIVVTNVQRPVKQAKQAMITIVTMYIRSLFVVLQMK